MWQKVILMQPTSSRYFRLFCFQFTEQENSSAAVLEDRWEGSSFYPPTKRLDQWSLTFAAWRSGGGERREELDNVSSGQHTHPCSSTRSTSSSSQPITWPNSEQATTRQWVAAWGLGSLYQIKYPILIGSNNSMNIWKLCQEVTFI